MKITREILSRGVTLEYFCKFIQILDICGLHSHVIDDVLCDYIVPCNIHSLDIRKYESLSKIVKNFNDVDLTYIDVFTNNSEIEKIISKISNLPNHKVYEYEDSIGIAAYSAIIDTPLVFYVRFINDVTQYNVFSHNYIGWSNNEIVLIKDIIFIYSSVFYNWFRNSAPQYYIKILNKYVNEKNDDVIEQISIKYVCETIIQKKIYYLLHYINNLTIDTYIVNIYLRGYILADHEDNIIKVTDKYNEKCKLCSMEFNPIQIIDNLSMSDYDQKLCIIYQPSCGHRVHLSCMYKLSPSGSLYCLVCRKKT
jgi:hypothetical protein